MIVALIDTLAEKLAYEDRLKTNQAEVKSIEAMLRALDPVAKMARSLVDQLETCAPHIGQQAEINIRTQAHGVSAALHDSRQRFATNRKEWLLLRGPSDSLQRATKDLAEGWKDYANGRVKPYLDMLKLVNYLPEVSGSSGEINKIVRQLQDQAKSPPEARAHLELFHDRLDELGRRLDAVARLPPGVRNFLARVIDNQATLADLSPEVRSWIEDGGRAAAFSISFSQGRS